MKAKPLIVTPYFGKLPPWYGLFMLSIERNPEWTWLLVTDAPIPTERPRNLRAVAMTLAGFNALAAAKLGFDPGIVNPYKVTELKPAYGKIFEDFTGGYTHWGFGDCDVLMGRMADYFSDEVLDAYDAFSSCRCSITGQFALFRNAPELRDFYRGIPDYAARVRSERVGNLDEIPADEALAAGGFRVLRRQLQIHDAGSEEWRQWAERLERQEKGTLDGFFWEGGEADWLDGRLVHTATGREAMFYHFHYWKKDWNLPDFPYWPGEIRAIHVRRGGLEAEFASARRRFQFTAAHRLPHAIRSAAGRGRAFAGRVKRGLVRRLKLL